MSRSYHVPNADDFTDLDSFANRIADEFVAAPGADRSTQSINGEQRITVTSYTMSDVLQGTLNHRDPQETSALLNKALTDQLGFLDASGIGGLASTSGQTAATINLGGQVSISDGGAGGTFPGSTDTAGMVRQEWVEQLPTTHPNGALIWHNKGKGSREMHLPTDENLDVDKAQHKQHNFTEEEWKHPWNMDRRGGGIGGESGYWTSVQQSHGTIMKDDNPTEGGQQGAFGILTPENEQYYISMGWPYKSDNLAQFKTIGREDIWSKGSALSKDDYRNKKILVYSVNSKKACVATPGDWGPHPKHSVGQGYESIDGFYFGLSPDIHHVLDTNHGSEFIIGWLPDNTPVGPFNPTPTQGFASGGLAATGTTLLNTDEEMAYAGQMIVNHPNFWLDGRDGGVDARSFFLNGYKIDSRAVNMTPAKQHSDPTRGWPMPSLLNWMWRTLEGGYILGYCGGAYGFKYISGTTKPSNHGKGGAIDIGAIGLASEGRTYSTWNLGQSRHMCEQIIDFWGSLGEVGRPRDFGGPYETNNPFRIHFDEGHFHFGFREDECGQLMPALKPQQSSSPSGIRRVQ